MTPQIPACMITGAGASSRQRSTTSADRVPAKTAARAHASGDAKAHIGAHVGVWNRSGARANVSPIATSAAESDTATISGNAERRMRTTS